MNTSACVRTAASSRECGCVCEHSSVNAWRWMDVSQSDLHPPGVWLIEPAVETRLSHTQGYFECAFLQEKKKKKITVPVISVPEMSCYYERPSPDVEPTNSSLTLPVPLCVWWRLAILWLGISASAFSLSFIIPISSPLSPSFLTLFFCFIIFPPVSVFLSPSG